MKKKGMTMWMTILMILGLFAAIVIFVIIGQRAGILQDFNNKCEDNGGVCTVVKNCSLCDSYTTCKSQNPYACDIPTNICCPQGGLI